MLLQSFHKLRFVAFSLVACMMLVTTSYAQEGLDGGSRAVGDGSSAQQRVGSVFRDANGVLQVVIPLEVLLKANNGLLQGSARHDAHGSGGSPPVPDPPADEPTEIAGSFRTVNGLDANARGGDEEEDPDAQESTQIAGFGRVPSGLDSNARSSNLYVIHLSSGYNEYKSYTFNGQSFRLDRGKYRWHQSANSSVRITYDQILGSGRRYVTETIRPGTYEFRRNGNDAYLVKVR